MNCNNGDVNRGNFAIKVRFPYHVKKLLHQLYRINILIDILHYFKPVVMFESGYNDIIRTM